MTTAVSPLILLLALLQTKPATQPQHIVTRSDVVMAFIALERAWHEHAPADDAARVKANAALDSLAEPMHLRKYSQVVRALHGLTDTIAPDAPYTPRSTAARVARALRVRIAPWVAEAKPAVMRIKLSPLYPLDIDESVTLRLRIAPDQPGAGPLIEREVVVAASGMTPVLIFQQPSGAAVGRYRVELIAPDGFAATCGKWFIADRSIDWQRDENARRLSTNRAGTEKLNQAISAVIARNALLAHQHAETESIEMLIDPVELSQQISGEIDAIDQDRDPFVDRAGDYWRTILLGSMNVAARIYAPKAAVDGKQVPVVIALHGAGGDENTFMEAYGLGEIKRQADRLGFLVVAPRTDFVMIVPDAVEQLVRALSHDYLIDRARVSVVGHSLGAITAQRWAERYGPKLAAVCQLGGAGPFSTEARLPPTLIIQGQHDPLFGADQIKEYVEAAQRAKQPVELRILPNQGHTLLVADALPQVMEWFMQHSAKAAATTAPTTGQ